MTKNLKKSEKIFTIMVMLCSLSLCIIVADFLSTAITVGSFGNSVVSSANTSFSVYAISLAKSQSKTSATSSAESIKIQNGAGYVWKIEENFHVLASCYENLTDAEKVSKKLTSSGHLNEIKEIKFDEVNISGEFSLQEKNTLSASIGLFKKCYQELYDLSVELDTKVSSNIAIKIKLADIKTHVIETQTKQDAIFNTKINNNLLILKICLNELNEKISALCNLVDESYFSQKIKYAYFEVLKTYENFVDEINQK